MKKKWVILIIVCALVVLTLGVGLYVRGQQKEKEIKDAVTIRADGRDIVAAVEDLNKTVFEGETVDGKGEHSTHSYRGVLLRDLLREKGIDTAKITGASASSADQYTAEFTSEEVLADDRLYLAVEIDGSVIPGIEEGTRGVQVIVFGDENMRRCVRNLAVIEIRQ